MHVLYLPLLRVYRLLPFGHTFFIDCLKLIFLLLDLSLLFLSRRKFSFFSQQCLHLLDLFNVSISLRFFQTLLQSLKSFILVLFNKGVAWGEKTLIQVPTWALETRISSEVWLCRPDTPLIPTGRLLSVQLLLYSAHRQFWILHPWLMLVFYLALSLGVNSHSLFALG